MAKKSPVLYSVGKTFMWFAIVSIILTGCLLAIVYMDTHREWKEYQKKFIAMKVKSASEALKKAQGAVDKKKLETLKKDLASFQQTCQR